MDIFNCVSPLDYRYYLADETLFQELNPYVSHAAQIAYQLKVELALVKAMAGDVSSPFGGFVAFNTPLEIETAKLVDKMFIEGVIAPEFEEKTPELLKDTSKIKTHANRFLIQTGNLKPRDLNYFGFSLQPVRSCG